MSVLTEIDALVAALQPRWTTRLFEQLAPVGSVTITVVPPDIQTLGYTDVPCPPAGADVAVLLLIMAAQSSADSARNNIADLFDVAEACHQAGWTPETAEPGEVSDRPCYVLRITKTAIPA